MVKYIDSLLESEQIPCVDSCGWNAVHYAAQLNLVNILEYFHAHPQRYALFNTTTGKGWWNGKESVFVVAARYKAHDAIRYLATITPNQLNSADQNYRNALEWAYDNKDIILFELLITLGANPNPDYDLMSLCCMCIFSNTPDSILHKIC